MREREIAGEKGRDKESERERVGDALKMQAGSWHVVAALI